MVMDESSRTQAAGRLRLLDLLALCLLAAAGCSTYIGSTAKSFMKHVRNDPDPNIRYVAYTKLADPRAYDSEQEKAEAVWTLIDRYEHGHEPLATRAMICRTLGQLGDPRAHDLLVAAVSSAEPVIKIEACRALGKVGRSEDATILAQVMTLDNLEDARIAAIEGIAELKTKDPRIYHVLVENMDHDDPAIRLASLTALRKLTGKDHGTTPAEWRKQLKPMLDPLSARSPAQSAATAPAVARAPSPSASASASTPASATSAPLARP